MKVLRAIFSIILPALLSACINSEATSSTKAHHNSPEEHPTSIHIDGLDDAVIPSSIPQQIKHYEGFTVNFNASNRTPNYVAWELLATESFGPESRTNKFFRDPDIKNCPEHSDYRRSGYDRGHMYPAADAKWSQKSMEQCFSMANMCPQAHTLNAGAWKTLEEKERQWAERDSALVIIAGPIYRPQDKERIGMAGVRVPSLFFKAIIAPYLPQPRGIAFLYPNDRAPGNMQNYAMTIDQLEEILGYDLFPTLTPDLENKIESTTSFRQWDSH